MSVKINLKKNPGRVARTGLLLIMVGAVVLAFPGSDLPDLIFGIYIVFAGSLLVFWVHRIKVDDLTNEVLLQKGLLIPLRVKRFPITRIRKITLRETYVKGSKNDHHAYTIHLSGIKDALVLNHRDPWFARSIAERLAIALALPLDNRVYKKSSVRGPEDLDTPLIALWRKQGLSFSRPEPPEETQLGIRNEPDLFEVTIRAEHGNIKFAIPVLIAFGVMDFFMFLYAQYFPAVLFLFAVAFSFNALLAFSGRSRLAITADRITFRQGLSLFRATMPLAELEEMIVSTDGINLVGDHRAIWVHWGDSLQDSAYLEKVIPYELSQREVIR